MSEVENKTEEPTTTEEQEDTVGAPKGEVVVETQGVTYVLKTVEAKTGEETEEVLLNLYADTFYTAACLLLKEVQVLPLGRRRELERKRNW